MPTAQNFLDLDRCPQCNIAAPLLQRIAPPLPALKADGFGKLSWSTYQCRSCGDAVLCQHNNLGAVLGIYPQTKSYSQDIPERPRKALADANATLNTPSLSIVGSARAVDFMLHERGFPGSKGVSLASRITQAAQAHVITPDMKDWADEVRLDANAERHADVNTPDPTPQDAARALGFAEALAELLFELPAMVTRGRTQQPPTAPSP